MADTQIVDLRTPHAEKRKLSPPFMVVLSFFGAVLVGTLLLKLPVCTFHGITWLDAFFTATSAVCVTGLTVVDTQFDFTREGQVVILCLIQLGGLGILTLSTFFLGVIGGRVSISGRKLMQEAISQVPYKNPLTMLIYIVGSTLLIEAIGAWALYQKVGRMDSVTDPVFFSIFHSVSAYCNAGFSLLSDSFCSYNTYAWINMVITFLVILGGIGFLVMMELQSWLWQRLRGQRVYLSLYSKLVLRTTLALLVIGTAFVLILEWNNEFAGMNLIDRVMNAWFISVNARTAGFNMVPMQNLTAATLLFIVLLMIIGGSPASTAGGVKTTTVAVMLAALRSRLHDREQVEIFGRTVSRETVTRATATMFMAVSGLFITLFLILIIGSGFTPSHGNPPGFFLDRLFEVASALGTVGLSTGVTPELRWPSKCLIILCMFAGRVGPLTLAVSMFTRPKASARYKYPEEPVLVG